MKRNVWQFPAFLLLLVFWAAACGKQSLPADNPKTNADMDKIEYRFRDSSTPPRYHRSYTVTVTPEQVHATVDVYGTILADTTHATPPGKFEELRAAAAQLESEKERIAEGATGTKGYSISLFSNGERYYHLYWDSLSKVKPHSEEYAKLIKSACPALGALLMTPLKEDDGE